MTSTSGVRLVLDQGIPRDAAAFLRERGKDCVHVGEVGMSTASDEQIVTWSRERSATIVTLDADFHTILAVSRASVPSVIRIPVEGLNAFAVVKLIEQVTSDFADELSDGCLVTVKANKTTCHKLPIGGVD